MPAVLRYGQKGYQLRVLASESLAQGAFVNIYDNGGTANVRNACTTGSFEAHGFVNDVVASGDVATIETDGINAYQAGLSVGNVWLSSTPGLATSTMPGSGLVQQVGVAVSASNVIFSVGTAESSSSGGGTASLTFTIVTSVDVAAGDFVNIFNSSGTLKIRKADASLGQGYEAHGFVLGAFATAATATVYGPGNINSSLSGLATSEPRWLGTAGASSATPDETVGHITQEIGYAISATEMVFDPQPDVLRTTVADPIANVINIAAHRLIGNPTASIAPVVAIPVSGDIVWDSGTSLIIGIVGGSNHQVLAKTSGSDYAYGWTSALQGLTITNSSASLNFERETIISLAAGNGSNAVDWSLGGVARLTVTGSSCAITHSNLPSGVGGTMLLELTNGGLGVTSTMFSGVLWPGGVVPTLTSSGFDLVSLYCSNGSNIHGAVVQLDSR